AAGLPDGQYKLGVNDVIVENGDARLAVGSSRAGSTLTMIRALRNILAFTGAPLEKALPLLTENPARLLGIDGRTGSLAPGKDADIVLLDSALRVRATYVAGQAVYLAR
ncbi:MAG: amidohydrolase family protein, partial [Clostridia bacterium]|nr:amidohydrolase family protein [Clostridia bacterium]